MSRTIKLLVLAILPCCSFWLMAQQGTSSSQPQEHGKATPSRTAEITIRGCVSGGRRYTFMQASTGAMFGLIGKTDRFAPIQGKLIEVKANEFAPKINSDELPKLQVNNLRVISNKCPIQTRVPSRRVIPSSARQAPPANASANTEPYADPGTINQTPPNVENPNTAGDSGAPSPGTGNPPPPQK